MSKNLPRLRKYTITAMCITLCAVLPLALHAIPGAANTVLPMHIPVLICGLVVGWKFGLMAGLFGPMLSSFTTGMPAPSYMPIMMIELAVYGMVCGLMMLIMHGRNKYVNIYTSLILAMILGRIFAGAARALFFAPGTVTMALWVSSYFITSLPGIILQLIIIPIIITALEKSGISYTTNA